MGAPQEPSSILSRYFSDISSRPVLTREQEADLVERYNAGCREALDELVEANLRFVVKVAGEYRHLGVPYEDLINEGNVGLLEAARSFDSSKGNKFITYAMWWVRKYILKAIDDHSSVVRIPSYQRTQGRKFRRVQDDLRASLGREPHGEEISRKIGKNGSIPLTPPQQWLETSLDGTDHDRPSLASALADGQGENPEALLLRQEIGDVISRAISELSEKEKSVISSRYGLDGEPHRTLREIGVAMGVSRERARQIEQQAKARLRRMLLRRGLIKSPLMRRALRQFASAVRSSSSVSK